MEVGVSFKRLRENQIFADRKTMLVVFLRLVFTSDGVEVGAGVVVGVIRELT